jgi:ATP adenylyltransferase
MKLVLQKGTLWRKVLDATAAAREVGSLHPIPTRLEHVEEEGVRFIVRVLTGRPRKYEEASKEGNPFLLYDESLFVGELTDSYVCLLNKFNVVEHHLLAVTRVFEDQEDYLTVRDFAAFLAGLAEFDCLAFYNGGVTAGASQPHRHLQFVALPMDPGGPAVPVEPLVAGRLPAQGQVGSAASLPFRHALAPMDPAWVGDPLGGARGALERYHRMLRAAGMERSDSPARQRQSGPYNLLVTRRWMLLVPRSTEFFNGASVNALGFAGSLLVKDEDQFRDLKSRGPMTALRSVAFPREEGGA